MRAHLRAVNKRIGNTGAGMVERLAASLFTPGGEDSGATWQDGTPMESDYYGATLHVAAARLVFRYGRPNPRRDVARRDTAGVGSWWLENVLIGPDGRARLVGSDGSGNDARALADSLRAAWSGR
jgi:hypothetical protein